MEDKLQLQKIEDILSEANTHLNRALSAIGEGNTISAYANTTKAISKFTRLRAEALIRLEGEAKAGALERQQLEDLVHLTNRNLAISEHAQARAFYNGAIANHNPENLLLEDMAQNYMEAAGLIYGEAYRTFEQHDSSFITHQDRLVLWEQLTQLFEHGIKAYFMLGSDARLRADHLILAATEELNIPNREKLFEGLAKYEVAVRWYNTVIEMQNAAEKKQLWMGQGDSKTLAEQRISEIVAQIDRITHALVDKHEQ